MSSMVEEITCSIPLNKISEDFFRSKYYYGSEWREETIKNRLECFLNEERSCMPDQWERAYNYLKENYVNKFPCYACFGRGGKKGEKYDPDYRKTFDVWNQCRRCKGKQIEKISDEHFEKTLDQDEMRSYVSEQNGDPDSAYEYLNGLEVNGRYKMTDIETFLNR